MPTSTAAAVPGKLARSSHHRCNRLRIASAFFAAVLTVVTMGALDPRLLSSLPRIGSSQTSGDSSANSQILTPDEVSLVVPLRSDPLPQPDFFILTSNASVSSTSSSSSLPPYLADDRLVAVTAVIVMETGRPDRPSDAAKFLHERHRFIQELVLWNNHNLTMNHHMLSYDLAVRYVKASRDYGSYARALGCVLARHEICYFQHEALRPMVLDSLFGTFLSAASHQIAASRAHPDNEIVVAIMDADLVDRARQRHCCGHVQYRDEGGGCAVDHVFTHVDWDMGAMAHKDVIKRHITNLKLVGRRRQQDTDEEDDSSAPSFPRQVPPQNIIVNAIVNTKAIVSDLIMSYGLKRPPILLAHRMSANGVFKTRRRDRVPSDAVAGAAIQLVSRFVTCEGNVNPLRSPLATTRNDDDSDRERFKAPCLRGKCTLVTNMGRRSARVVNARDQHLRQNRTSLGTSFALGELASMIMRQHEMRAASASPTIAAPVISWTSAYEAAVDGDPNSAWLATWHFESSASSNKAADVPSGTPYIGLELLRPTLVTGMRLMLAAPATSTGEEQIAASAAVSDEPRLEYAFLGSPRETNGNPVFVPAENCKPAWTWVDGTAQKHGSHGGVRQRMLTFSCSATRVIGARLVFHKRTMLLELGNQNLHGLPVSEIAFVRLPLTAPVQTGAQSPSSGLSAPKSADQPPRGLVKASNASIMYVLAPGSFDASHRGLEGSTLSLLEEACEIGARGANVTVVDLGSLLFRHDHAISGSRKAKIQKLAVAFEAASGSSCDLRKSLKFVEPTTEHYVLSSATDVAVIFVQVRKDMLVAVQEFARRFSGKTSILVARLTEWDGNDTRVFILANALLTTFDATTAPNKHTYFSLDRAATRMAHETTGRASAETRQHRLDMRIMYPLRTLPSQHQQENKLPLLLTPSNPPVEEVVLLSTPTTTRRDIDLFETHAWPVLSKHEIRVQRVNVTRLVEEKLRDVASVDIGATATRLQRRRNRANAQTARIDAAMRRPKWTSVRELLRYVSIYPARCLWILDGSSAIAAYYASAASAAGARFVVSPTGMPHHANRFLAWNSTADWSGAGFAMKARELVRGRYFWSSSTRDRDYLRADASDILLDDWPVKREMEPIAHMSREIERYIASLLAVRRWGQSV